MELLGNYIFISIIAFSLGFYTRHKIKGLTVIDKIDQVSETLQTVSEDFKNYKPKKDTIQDRTTKSQPVEEQLTSKEKAELEEARKWKKTDESYESTFNTNKRNRDSRKEAEREKEKIIKAKTKEAQKQYEITLAKLHEAEEALESGEGLEALKKKDNNNPTKPNFLK